MTSKIKCPFCGTRMTKIAGELYDSFGCQNDECHYKYGWISEAVLQALTQAKQDLEQSEKCCSAWEIQALDYKAETIALSGKLEIARNVLKEIKMCCADEWIYIAADKAIELLEHKE